MKRTFGIQTRAQTRALKKIKKEKFKCLICFEDFPEPETEEDLPIHPCRRCKKVICDTCIYDYMRFTIEKAKQQGRRPMLECPHCRLTPWFPQLFYVESPGRPYTGDVSCRITLVNRSFYYLHAIHDNTNIVGYVSIEYRHGFFEKERSYHIDDIEELEKFAKPFDELIYEARKSTKCVIGTEDDLEHFGDNTFQDGFIKINTSELEAFINSKINPF